MVGGVYTCSTGVLVHRDPVVVGSASSAKLNLVPVRFIQGVQGIKSVKD